MLSRFFGVAFCEETKIKEIRTRSQLIITHPTHTVHNLLLTSFLTFEELEKRDPSTFAGVSLVIDFRALVTFSLNSFSASR